jgi:hypothetical protein
VILLDEPELHLNPGLLQGLTDFYHRHLGQAKNNQIWLTTHSDTLLRQAVGNSNYSVYHMATATSIEEGENQAREVVADSELERATLDLVGDLATYKPRAKVVIFEGGGDSQFDVSLTARLFPDFARRVNLVSGGGKRRVRDLYETLQETATQIGSGQRFFAILDRDSDPEARPPPARVLHWSVYHIENFLLEERFIRDAVVSVTGNDPFASEDEVTEALRQAAAQIVGTRVIEQLSREVNDAFIGAIRVGAGPDGEAESTLRPSIEASIERFKQEADALMAASLDERVAQIRESLQDALSDGSWREEFPGRLILRRFVGTWLGSAGISYEAFRNVIIDRMAEARHEPTAMKTVLDQVLTAN